MSTPNYTDDMLHYLAWRLFQEMYGAVEWVEGEAERITTLVAEAGNRLTDEERNVVENRVLRMGNEYEEFVSEQIREEYGDEYDDGDNDFHFAPIEINWRFYELWKQGVAKRRTVKIKYDSPTSGMHERLVDPYKSSAPYGEGYCHTRKEVRKFRFDRVIEITLTDNQFEKPKQS